MDWIYFNGVHLSKSDLFFFTHGLGIVCNLIFFKKKLEMANYKFRSCLGLFFFMVVGLGFAHNGRFQQAVSYRMQVDMDVATNRYQGTQVLAYTNNSPDTLNRVFYHLYYLLLEPYEYQNLI